MTPRAQPSTQETLHPLLSLMLLVLLVFVGLCLGMFLALAAVVVLYPITIADLESVLARPADYPYGWSTLMWIQGLSLLGGFGAGAVALPIIRKLRPINYFMPRRPVPLWWLPAAMGLIIVSLPALSGLIKWNAELHLPPALYEMEHWARLKEDQVEEMTTFLTRFKSLGQFLTAIGVVAVIPAVAEELTFRGVVLRQFARLTGSVHWGVWLSAIVFSAIHMQFFGFFPRMVLGVLLGYLFAWSGNILVSMAAHFAQNALQLLLLYLQQRGQITFDADANEALPWPMMLASLLLTLGLLYWLYQRRVEPAAAAPGEAHVLTSRGVHVRANDVPPPTEAHTLSRRGLETPPENPSI